MFGSNHDNFPKSAPRLQNQWKATKRYVQSHVFDIFVGLKPAKLADWATYILSFEIRHRHSSQPENSSAEPHCGSSPERLTIGSSFTTQLQHSDFFFPRTERPPSTTAGAWMSGLPAGYITDRATWAISNRVLLPHGTRHPLAHPLAGKNRRTQIPALDKPLRCSACCQR